MENATKALLIAAAVLVAILIISLGVGIFNSASELTNDAANLDEYQIQTHNDKFLSYEGDAVSGSKVNAMLTTVFNHNASQDDETLCVSVDVDEKDSRHYTAIDGTSTMTETPDEVHPNKKFTVFCVLDKRTKLVKNIVAKEND